MIRRLRGEFIRIAMLAVTLVLLLLTVSVNAVNYISVSRQQDRTLEMIVSHQGTIPAMPKEAKSGPHRLRHRGGYGAVFAGGTLPWGGERLAERLSVPGGADRGEPLDGGVSGLSEGGALPVPAGGGQCGGHGGVRGAGVSDRGAAEPTGHGAGGAVRPAAEAVHHRCRA